MFRPRRASRAVVAALVLLVVLVAALRGAAGPSHHGGGQTAGHGRPVAARTLAATSPSVSGPCGVPGIGDIGGLLGFCTLGQSGLIGGINNLCQPGVPQPEPATSGVDALIKPPAPPGKPIATPYNQYGMSGLSWAPTDMQCSDMTALIGNDVAGMLFDFAKALDRVTITVYQSAAGEGILSWLQNVTDHLISGLGNAIYFPYVALVVILAAIWLAWQGLIRKRGTRTIEGTIWMVLACAAAIWLIGRPADFTGVGKGVSDGISTTLNTAFANLPSPGQASCLPVTGHDPQISKASFSYTSSRTVVDQNANELWTVLVCKPWLDGEFGTTAFKAGGKPTPVSSYARQLLWAQAIAVNEKPTPALVNAKQAAYQGIATTIKNKDPSVYPLFQGKQWTTRLEIGFAALLAALVAGVLVLLISVTLILLKLGFLLLLIVGPFFLLIGTHPGFGRVVAVRWFEMLVGVLLKQAAVALALSVLLYCYALIMGTSDAVLPWALKILMITLVTVAVFIYRKPFQHLFTAVGYGAIGSSEAAEASLSRAASAARDNTRSAATLGVPGFAAYRAARWARRNPAQAAGLALSAASAVGAGAAASGAAAGAAAEAGSGEYAGAVPAGAGAGGSGDPSANGGKAGAGATSRVKAWAASAVGGAAASDAPPLRLPVAPGTNATRSANGGSSSSGQAAGGAAAAKGAAVPAGGNGTGMPPPLPSVVRSAGQAAAGRAVANGGGHTGGSGGGQRALGRPGIGGGSGGVGGTAGRVGSGASGASGARSGSQAPRLAGTPVPPSWVSRGQAAPRRSSPPRSSGTGWPGSPGGGSPGATSSRLDPAPPVRQAARTSEQRPSAARSASAARRAPAARPAPAQAARQGPAPAARPARSRPWSRLGQGGGAAAAGRDGAGGSGGSRGSGSRGAGQGRPGGAPDRGKSGSGGSSKPDRAGSSGHASSDGNFSAAPYGLLRSEREETSGPFWSRPTRRRK